MKRKLTDQIIEAILRDFVRGKNMQNGDKLPTVRELATYYNISLVTITEALSRLEERNLVECIQGSGCYVRHGCEWPLDGGIRRLAIVTHKPFYGFQLDFALYHGVAGRCEDFGIELMEEYLAESYDQERETVARARQDGADAIIVYPSPRTRSQLREDYLACEFQDLRIMLVDMAYEEQKRSAVIMNNFAAGQEMTQRLIEAGFKKIVFAKMQKENQELCHKSNEDRYDGYLWAMRRAGLAPEILDIYERNRKDEFYQPTREWISSLDEPAALIGIYDLHARFALETAQASGLRIPEDFLATGFDNATAMQGSYAGRIPTTQPDFAELGKVAVDELLRMNTHPSRPICHYVLPLPIFWPTEPRRETPLRASRERQPV